MMQTAATVLGVCALLVAGAVVPGQAAAGEGACVNDVDVYRARWWGAPGSKHGRPIYQVARIDNGCLALRHAIVEGRPLDCYRMPYWSIRSFVSVVNGPAELPCRGHARWALGGKAAAAGFVVREGFDLASTANADVLRITNRGAKAPLRLEQWHVVAKGDPAVQVLVRATNTSGQPMRDVQFQVIYDHDFNWSRLATSDGGAYKPLKAPTEGTASAFLAFSAGMRRGYELIAGDDCRLWCKLDVKLNAWRVALSRSVKEMAPGASATFRYAVRTLGRAPRRPHSPRLLATEALLALQFRTVTPAAFRTAPIKHDGRVMLPQVIASLARPKVRGLNLRAGVRQVFKDLDTLKDWGCTLVITHLGKREHTAKVIEAGHTLGMEMFLSGRGSFLKGAPSFDVLYATPLPPAQQADSHGQDEDHYYWYATKPTRDFAADFGKPMAQATQDEMVRYWSRCFVDKWKGVLADVRKHAPRGGIWFYDPSPCVAHVDPLDHYDTFFREIATLGDALTVFPFYYGIEYSQAEYMMRRWKDAGVHRAVFLPMRGFMSKPSQFVRAITAARRGQADGACGFSFAVGDEKPSDAWQWKAVMLASWANFPTPELGAWCFIEEPAELVEALAACDVTVVSHSTDVGAFAARLDELLPGEAKAAATAPEPLPPGRLCIVVGGPPALPKGAWPYDPRKAGPGKGVVQMRGRTVSLCGADAAGVANAMKLLARFAELARAERGQ